MSKRILIFGAGKIGRGFVGHLFHRSGYALTFVDPVPAVVNQLNADRSYPLFVLGAPDKNESIPVVQAILTSNENHVFDAIESHDLFVSAVGGPNLQSVGQLLGKGLLRRLERGVTRDANVIVCENFKDPASILRNACNSVDSSGKLKSWSDAHLGFAETQVLRSCIEPDPEMKKRNPLSVQVQDWWVLPCDAAGFKGPPPQCDGLKLKENFQNELIRKVYTYNCSNATISYLGFLKGHTMLSEATNDPQILAMAHRVYDESGQALISEFNLDPKEQTDLQNFALSKYLDRTILDPIERNGRDTQRKLSPTDRLVGPANLAIKHGVTPTALGIAIAAGFHYAGSNDPGTRHVQQLMHTRGLKAAISEICQTSPDSTLGKLILQGVPELQQYNRIGTTLIYE